MSHPAHMQTPATPAYFECYLQAWRRRALTTP